MLRSRRAARRPLAHRADQQRRPDREAPARLELVAGEEGSTLGSTRPLSSGMAWRARVGRALRGQDCGRDSSLGAAAAAGQVSAFRGCAVSRSWAPHSCPAASRAPRAGGCRRRLAGTVRASAHSPEAPDRQRGPMARRTARATPHGPPQWPAFRLGASNTGVNDYLRQNALGRENVQAAMASGKARLR